MWKLFNECNLLRFDLGVNDDLEQRNKFRKQALFNLNYKSPFRVGMDVFVSIPSTPSKPPWSGVAGVQKLLGSKGLSRLVEMEKQRISEQVNKFLGKEGVIIVFQKDAYNNIVSNDSEIYSLEKAIKGDLFGKFFNNSDITVYGVAPTRFLNGGPARKNLINLIGRLANQ